MSEKDMPITDANVPEEENSDRAMEALFKALEESGQLESFLENQRRIEEIAQAAVLGMHADPRPRTAAQPSSAQRIWAIVIAN